MEIFAYIALAALALAFLFDRLDNFLKRLQGLKPKGLLEAGKSVEIGLTISSKNKKDEVCATHTNSTQKRLD